VSCISTAGSSSVIPTEAATAEQLMAAEHYFIIARNLEREGNYEEALKAYEFAWRSDLNSEYLPEYLTELALKLNKPGKALVYMSRGKTADSLDDKTLKTMSSLFLSYGSYKEALYLFKEVDSLSSSDSIYLANLLEKSGYLTEAISVYKEKLPDSTILKTVKIGDLYRRSNLSDSSLVWYNKAINLDSTNRDARRGIALNYLGSKKSTEGVEILNSLIDDTTAGVAVDRISHEALGLYYASKNEYDNAIIHFELIYINSGTVEDFYLGRTLAIYNYLSQNYSKSAEIITELLLVDSDDHELLHLRGSIYEIESNVDSAIIYFHKSLEINDKYSDSYKSLILIYLRNRNFEKAVVVAKNFTIKQPNEQESWALLGSIQNINGNFLDATVSLNKAMALGVQSGPIKFELAMALERTSGIDSAIILLNEVIAEDSTHAPAANYLGYIWAEKGENLEESRKLIELALSLDPKNGAYLDSYGWVLYQQGEYKKSIDFLIKSAEVIDYDYVVYYHLAEAYIKLDDKENALKFYIKANSFENSQKSEIEEKIKILEGDSE
jgi:tetratricopeptide (TPR) repeat protein